MMMSIKLYEFVNPEKVGVFKDVNTDQFTYRLHYILKRNEPGNSWTSVLHHDRGCTLQVDSDGGLAIWGEERTIESVIIEIEPLAGGLEKLDK